MSVINHFELELYIVRLFNLRKQKFLVNMAFNFRDCLRQALARCSFQLPKGEWRKKYVEHKPIWHLNNVEAFKKSSLLSSSAWIVLKCVIKTHWGLRRRRKAVWNISSRHAACQINFIFPSNGVLWIALSNQYFMSPRLPSISPPLPSSQSLLFFRLQKLLEYGFTLFKVEWRN